MKTLEDKAREYYNSQVEIVFYPNDEPNLWKIMADFTRQNNDGESYQNRIKMDQIVLNKPTPLAEKIRNMLIDNRDNFESWSVQKQDQVIQQVIDHHLSDVEQEARAFCDQCDVNHKEKIDNSTDGWWTLQDLLTQFTKHILQPPKMK